MGSCLEKLSKKWWLASMLMLTIVSFFSLMPFSSLPPAPGSDKFHHFISYALVVFPIALRMPRFWWVFVFIVVGWSGCIELIQPYVNRYGEWLDLLANAVGVFIGCLCGALANVLFIKSGGQKAK